MKALYDFAADRNPRMAHVLDDDARFGLAIVVACCWARRRFLALRLQRAFAAARRIQLHSKRRSCPSSSCGSGSAKCPPDTLSDQLLPDHGERRDRPATLEPEMEDVLRALGAHRLECS